MIKISERIAEQKRRQQEHEAKFAEALSLTSTSPTAASVCRHNDVRGRAGILPPMGLVRHMHRPHRIGRYSTISGLPPPQPQFLKRSSAATLHASTPLLDPPTGHSGDLFASSPSFTISQPELAHMGSAQSGLGVSLLLSPSEVRWCFLHAIQSHTPIAHTIIPPPLPSHYPFLSACLPASLPRS
jgi:hypothetical protein